MPFIRKWVLHSPCWGYQFFWSWPPGISIYLIMISLESSIFLHWVPWTLRNKYFKPLWMDRWEVLWNNTSLFAFLFTIFSKIFFVILCRQHSRFSVLPKYPRYHCRHNYPPLSLPSSPSTTPGMRSDKTDSCLFIVAWSLSVVVDAVVKSSFLTEDEDSSSVIMDWYRESQCAIMVLAVVDMQDCAVRKKIIISNCLRVVSYEKHLQRSLMEIMELIRSLQWIRILTSNDLKLNQRPFDHKPDVFATLSQIQKWYDCIRIYHRIDSSFLWNCHH